ncbi:MAG TPA: hypothetical protein PKN95_03075 [Verrucomicrobiota bacterium]|nr:hypothetical protein [Verrucomicrobiota bacterium]HNT13295.1 hypothetical protein [Verrucomicrobiota bacterium]
MKTPRDILFHRHRPADAKLDRIRHQVVAKLSRPVAPLKSNLPWRVLSKLWDELVWPCWRTWAALAAMWLLVLGVNASLRDPGTTTLANPTRAGGMMLALPEQERLLAELSEPLRTRAAASPQKPTPAAHQPRSDRRDTIRRPVYA